MFKKLSIVIPAYNEEKTIEELVRTVMKVELEVEKEILIIDDKSSDSTVEKITKLVEENQEIRIFRNDVNRGKGFSIRRGFEEATGDIIMIQDADLEYDPYEYPKLLKPIIDGKADVVYGSRFLSSEARRVLYFWHSLGNRFLTLCSNMITNINLTDMETCYKVFRSEFIKNLDLKENRFGIEPEMTFKLSKIRDIRFYEIGISYQGRTYAEGKKINWKDGIRAFLVMGKCFCQFILKGSKMAMKPEVTGK